MTALTCFLSHFISFAFLFPDVEKADTGPVHLKNISAVDISKQGELMQIGRLAIHICADIKHQNGLSGILCWEQGADGRTVNPLQSSESKDR